MGVIKLSRAPKADRNARAAGIEEQQAIKYVAGEMNSVMTTIAKDITGGRIGYAVALHQLANLIAKERERIEFSYVKLAQYYNNPDNKFLWVGSNHKLRTITSGNLRNLVMVRAMPEPLTEPQADAVIARASGNQSKPKKTLPIAEQLTKDVRTSVQRFLTSLEHLAVYLTPDIGKVEMKEDKQIITFNDPALARERLFVIAKNVLAEAHSAAIEDREFTLFASPSGDEEETEE